MKEQRETAMETRSMEWALISKDQSLNRYKIQMKKQSCAYKVLTGFIIVLALFFSFILCIFKLIYKPQVEGSKEEDFYLNIPT